MYGQFQRQLRPDFLRDAQPFQRPGICYDSIRQDGRAAFGRFYEPVLQGGFAVVPEKRFLLRERQVVHIVCQRFI